jgi:spore maturation protein CgeB
MYSKKNTYKKIREFSDDELIKGFDEEEDRSLKSAWLQEITSRIILGYTKTMKNLTVAIFFMTLIVTIFTILLYVKSC